MPATLVYSNQTDVLKSMFKGTFDIYNTLGNVTDVWMDGKRNEWDNYQNCFFGDMLDLAYHMTGNTYYRNKDILVNIRNQQFDNYKSVGYDQLFQNPLTFGSEQADAEPLCCWRTGP